MRPIQRLNLTLNVEPAYNALAKSIRWDSHQNRTVNKGPHRHVSDIWARYGSLDDEKVKLDLPFDSKWYYPELTPVLAPLASQLVSYVQGVSLGGVLITKIPAGQQVYPHVDSGWHAGHHSKYCICIRANEQQSFCFEDYQLKTKTSEIFWFDNSESHWVLNPSEEDRISMIVCVRTSRGPHQP